MKKLFTAFSLFVAIANSSNAQNFIHYEPVRVEQNSRSNGTNPFESSSNTYSRPRQQQQTENLQVVNAYYVNGRGAWEKVRLQVGVSTYYSRMVVTVRAYYDKRLQRWQSVTSTASNVDVLDSDVVKENFEWKCFIPGFSTVYF